MSKPKKKGGKRAGAGRKPSSVKKEALTIYSDFSKFGGRDGARIAIYEFLNGDITNTGKTSFVPLEWSFKGAHETAKTKAIASLISQPEVVKSSPPKTLDELKKLCPKELTGLDRSAWISLQRQKYGI